ncbi:leucyl aminopeptidase [Profundibacterium mesophilum]|uniref:Probable cytosol aminopeptidase n=1 Tax=Profundibacterium mesophilum KAUST100406-0324 TaxID=1037889 RepID=A0A921NWP6_9RHOB|nr:leucyl aminopeptidase [Profundibacterium mesophilum]KAF0674933.1 putative cytosol aminopeptidase [Profundibacterium mesophilum KAUST100406-0324]
MTMPAELKFSETDIDAIAGFEGRVVVFVGEDGKLDPGARRVNKLMRGALERMVASKGFSKLEPGQARDMAFPSGLAAEAVQVIRLERKATGAQARRAGAAIGQASGRKPVLVLAGALKPAADLALAAVLRGYEYTDQKGGDAASPEPRGAITVMVGRPEEAAAAAADLEALAGGVFFTRDLVSAPANVLTTTSFAEQLSALGTLGLEVEVLDEPQLEELGMRALLAVGQGSESPSKVVVMQWNGGADGAAPLALIGKGVVFDTGGISLKPAGGMEDMTMDMGGAGTVAGAMRALAARKAKANVVGIVGLVENMPDGRAQRPGDVVRSMKGDTIEVINTDAEGRLVLADIMWYAQERFSPAGMIDLATLTGAVIVGLGHENAGVLSNDDGFCESFLSAARAEGEGAWRLPLGKGYAKMIKSDIADIKNSAGRAAGTITAAEFLHCFVKEGTPWIHLDIAGVASTKSDGPLAPKGASGWGVLSLDRLVRDRFEG